MVISKREMLAAIITHIVSMNSSQYDVVWPMTPEGCCKGDVLSLKSRSDGSGIVTRASCRSGGRPSVELSIL